MSASYLADEPGNKQENQNAVMVPTMAKEGVRHEGGEEGHLSVRLSYFHFPQLHLNGLETKSEVSCLNKENQQHWHRGCMSLELSYLGVSLGLCKLDLKVKQLSRWLLNLFCICILLTDQLPVGLLMHKTNLLQHQDNRTAGLQNYPSIHLPEVSQ